MFSPGTTCDTTVAIIFVNSTPGARANTSSAVNDTCCLTSHYLLDTDILYILFPQNRHILPKHFHAKITGPAAPPPQSPPLPPSPPHPRASMCFVVFLETRSNCGRRVLSLLFSGSGLHDYQEGVRGGNHPEIRQVKRRAIFLLIVLAV